MKPRKPEGGSQVCDEGHGIAGYRDGKAISAMPLGVRVRPTAFTVPPPEQPEPSGHKLLDPAQDAGHAVGERRGRGPVEEPVPGIGYDFVPHL